MDTNSFVLLGHEGIGGTLVQPCGKQNSLIVFAWKPGDKYQIDRLSQKSQNQIKFPWNVFLYGILSMGNHFLFVFSLRHDLKEDLKDAVQDLPFGVSAMACFA